MWAAGGDNYPAVSLVLHWNGSAWRQVSVPDVGSLDAAQVTPAVNPLQLTAIAADPAGNPWAGGWTAAQGTVKPAIINAPGIGQGGISVTTGASAATVTWIGPANGAGGTDQSGRFAVGGLPDGSYTVTASLPGCQPGVATAKVTAGHVSAVNAHITCPP